MSRRIKTENLALLYKIAAERFETLPAFATRESALDWKPVTYRELYEKGINLATGLIELGVNARDHVGIFGDNRFEWILSDCAVQLCGAADVPRGRDVTDDELAYIIDHSGMEVTFVETEKMMERILRLRKQLPNLREIILLDPKGKVREGVKRLTDILEYGSALRKRGDKQVEERIAGIKPDDLFTLIYTSGTTGKPKGVMLTHANMISQIRNLPGHHNANDRILSVLPIWHIFERVMEMYTLSFGGCTYYSSILTLGEDMRNVEPTFMASAPRLWEKLHERILKSVKASHPVRQVLFHIAYFLARQYKVSEYFITNKNLKLNSQPLWKTIILMPFHVIRWLIVLPWYGFFNAAVLERLRLGAGGSLKATISGGGALPIHIDKFFNYVGIPVLEGYGMTESSPVITVRSMDNLVVGTVGPPLPETEVRIIDPETGEILYPNSNLPDNGRLQRGEIWARGPQVMKGYYKDPELTNFAMRDGWLRTGDLGIITYNNCLKILGRYKATIVLSRGENVEPEPIEMRLSQSHYIDQCMLVGQNEKFVGALIVPELTTFQQAGFKEQSIEALAENPEAHKIIREEIRRMTAGSNGYKPYEQIRDFRLLKQSFKVGHEMTNLFKIKRHVVGQKFHHVIAEIFSSETSKK
ncbi:MAG: long-chain fatty acid--CoA ligase [Bacteroidales bacterium]|nr:long-chain fatty acid--CoA ligase [Bacteroidales bacterium]